MTTKYISAVLVLVMAFATLASAHEGKTHGTTIEGTIKSSTETSLSVATETGDITATLTSRTKLVDAENETIARSDLRLGAHVVIAGSKLPGGGISATEVIVHGVTGYTHQLDDLEGMAASAVRILTDAALRERMGSAARRRVVEQFDAERIVPLYEQYYEDILAHAAR